MKKVIVVYNPRSSQQGAVEREVLAETRKLRGYLVAKYEVKKAKVRENAEELAKIVGAGDLVIAAGGDGTATMAMNGVMLATERLSSGVEAPVFVSEPKDEAGIEMPVFAALGYGHFNDTARMLGVKRPVEYGDEYLGGVREIMRKYEAGETEKMYPLEVFIDGELWRYAAAYVTIGMMAEATRMFENPRYRKRLKTGKVSRARSYLGLARWYFSNRKREFLPTLLRSSEGADAAGLGVTGMTDMIVMNGPRMAGVLRGRKWFLKSEGLGAGKFRLRKFWPLVGFMLRGMILGVPVKEMKEWGAEFETETEVMIQAEGEAEKVKARKIEVKKGAGMRIITG